MNAGPVRSRGSDDWRGAPRENPDPDPNAMLPVVGAPEENATGAPNGIAV